MQSKELAFWKKASHSHPPESRVWGMLKQYLVCKSTQGAWRQELSHTGRSFQCFADLAEPKFSRNKEDRANVVGRGRKDSELSPPAQPEHLQAVQQLLAINPRQTLELFLPLSASPGLSALSHPDILAQHWNISRHSSTSWQDRLSPVGSLRALMYHLPARTPFQFLCLS